ncbi:hypothetical protein THRCLA_03403 [Thraustotheca clavata]|uniref:NADP-dependent oxidoreductase domain-containing protein n=1 Tax=Thraustotheca clavata TaxID=74557 RepID=A0A1W0A2S2_9STRA|nr:hypothetical protein THRCLA_03403 [Thraustotheca clavata]
MTASVMQARKLGSQGLEVSKIGLGAMGMTAFYGGDFDREAAEETNINTIGKALELGINFIDTAWIYQSFGADGKPNRTNEELVGKAIKRFGRDRFVIATKFGITMCDGSMAVSGKPEFVRQQLHESLDRLGIDQIDLYYMHRMDPSTPIEETVACLKELVDEGKIKYIGLSECSSDELRRAHAVHPISAIQMEWSLNSRDAEKTVIKTARELGVGIVAYSPLGRGLLTGKIASLNDLSEKDSRRRNPRFVPENFKNNKATTFFDLAAKKNVTPAQLALAWVLHRGDDVVPIPGTKQPARIIENAGAADISLTPEELEEIEQSIPDIAGERQEARHSGVLFNAREQ